MLRSKIFIIPLIFLGIILFFIGRIAYVQIRNVQTHFIPKQVSLTLQPPEGSIVASVDSLRGAVKKEGRTDDSFHDIAKPTTLLEGESLATDSTSSAVITFPNVVILSVGKNSQIDLVNALPQQIVIRQPGGTVAYTTENAVQPFSLRSLALLIQWNNPVSFSVTTSSTNQTVTVTLTKRALTLAYTDNNNTTQVAKLAARHTALFDNSLSTLTIR